MTVLVAGLGNVFFRDDGFGPAVARRLAEAPLPAGVRVVDAGIRGLHLAYELLDPPALLILVDLIQRGGPPGTVYLVEPDLETGEGTLPDAHAMTPAALVAAVRRLGGEMPRTVLVGCEPADSGEGMELSAPAAAAVAEAVRLIRDVIDDERRNDT